MISVTSVKVRSRRLASGRRAIPASRQAGLLNGEIKRHTEVVGCYWADISVQFANRVSAS